MCDAGRESLAVPRWGRLYAIVSVGVAVLAAVRFLARTPAAHAGLEAGVVAVTFTAMWCWVRANSAALDRLAWCACASATVTVRVIGGRRDDALRREPTAGVVAERCDAAPEAELEVVAGPARRS